MNRLRSRALATPALVALSAVIATGCLNGEAELKISDDGTGSISVEVFPPGRITDEIDVGDLEDLLEGSAASSEVQVETVDRDGVDGFRVEVPFDDYREAEAALQGGTTIAGQSVGLFSSLTIIELPDDQGWELTASLVPLDQVAGASPDGLTDLDQVLDAAGLSSTGSGFDLSVALPGTVATSNADSTDGGTATWRLDDPEVPPTLRMRTEPAPLITPYRLVVGGAGLAVLVGLLFAIAGASRQYRTSRRERRRARATQVTNPVSTAGWAGRGAAQGALGADVTTPGPGTPSLSDRPDPLPPLAAASSSTTSTAAAPPEFPAGPVPNEHSAPTPPAFRAAQPEAPAAAPELWAEPVAEEPSSTRAVSSVPAPGWYTDPADPARMRWWDGNAWTEHRR